MVNSKIQKVACGELEWTRRKAKSVLSARTLEITGNNGCERLASRRKKDQPGSLVAYFHWFALFAAGFS